MEWLLQYADPSIDWPYAMITLIVRFIGVFLVMLVMQVALQIAARVVKRIEAPEEDAAPATAPAPAPSEEPVKSLDVTAIARSKPEVEGAIAAAIGLALEIESQKPARLPTVPGSGPSSWAVAGRLRQLNRLAKN